MGPSWKEMFPWGSWAADNPGRIGNPRLILKGPWRFDPENGLWGGSYQLRKMVSKKYDLTHTQLTKVVQYTSRLPTERTGMLM